VTVLISTHRIELAGRLRPALEEEGYEVDLVPAVEQLDLAPEPGLLILTGEDDGDGEAWARAAHRQLEVPLFTSLPGGGGVVRGRELGAEQAFPPDPDPDEVALSAHRAMERRRLQRITGIVGRTEAMQEVLERVVQIAQVPSTVLITGESGTGKELVARGIHDLSPRRSKAFLAVNVAALSETLLESELFGHEKGAFTGAIDSRRGFFELAHKGSLFLDEIGEMPRATQTKLLRVLEQREFLRVGGEKPFQVDVRIIAATNRDLRTQVAEGEFRRDLYYRLNVLSIELPPLRERRADIPILIEHFVGELSRRMDRPFPGISPEAMKVLTAYDWPGNVRELRNLVESMVVLAPGQEIGPEDIPREIRSPRENRRLLPVPVSGAGAALQREAAAAGRAEEGGEGEEAGAGRSVRPELEFVFRTLVEMRMDMDELRREFEAYRERTEDLLEGEEGRWILSSAPGVEVGVAPRRAGEGSGRMSEEAAGAVGGSVDAPGGASRPVEGELGAGARAELESGTSPEAEQGEADQGNGQVVFRPGMTMEDLEEEAIRTVLRQTDGNRRKAAESLGIGERTLYRKIKRYEIEE